MRSIIRSLVFVLGFTLFMTVYNLAWSPIIPPEKAYYMWGRNQWRISFIKYFVEEWPGIAFDGSEIKGANRYVDPICLDWVSRAIGRVADATDSDWMEIMGQPWTETQFVCATIVHNDSKVEVVIDGKKYIKYYDSYGIAGINAINNDNINSKCNLQRHTYYNLDEYERCWIYTINTLKKSARYRVAKYGREAILSLSMTLGGNLPKYNGGKQEGPLWKPYVRKKGSYIVIKKAFPKYKQDVISGKIKFESWKIAI